MHLDDRDKALIAVGVVLLGVLLYAAYTNTDRTGQPRYEAPTGLTAAFGVIDSLDTGDHYFHPAHCVDGQGVVFTAHRYPYVSGGNISTLIHQGLDALRQPAPQDADWIERPPGEVMWL